jgi:antitoxin HicB
VPEFRDGGFILVPASEIDKPTRNLNPMSASREYEVVLTPEVEGGFSVAVPALPGCTSQSETREEALSMIREAIDAYIESLVAHGDPIPEPVEIGRVTVGA